MRISEQVKCVDFLCKDMDVSGYIIPDKEIEPESIKALMINHTSL